MSLSQKRSFSFAKTSISLLFLTFIAKILAFGRELAVAAYFGSNSDTDSFFIANELMGNILYCFATAFSAAFLPLYIEEKEKNGSLQASRFAGQGLIFFLIIAIVIFASVFSASGVLAKIVAPSVPEAQTKQIAFFICILAVGLIFSSLNCFNLSLLDSERIFGYVAFAGIIYSFVITLTAIFFSKTFGVLSLVFSVVCAYVLQFLFSGYKSRKFISLPQLCKKNSRLLNMLLISYPILLSNIAVEVNQIINRALAVKLGNGIVSSLTYASTLSIFVSSTLIYSLVTIFFTEFSKTACTNDASDKLKKLLRFALNILLCVLLPLSLITFLYAEDIVTITFKRGKFTADNVISTAQVLRWFAIGFMAVVCKTLFIKCFIAMKDTRTPMCVGICEVCLNISLTLMFYRRFQVAGIAVALSAANICAAAALLCLLNCKLKRHTILWSWKYTARILGSAAVSIIFLLLANRILENWNAWLRFPTAALIGFACFLPVYWFEWRNYCHIHNNSLTE